ncbi:CD4-1 molecule isoform X1 [Phycodurus eques]|uniref:CD4-1 molecule isoform X1 n=2 Tax=Phycodurus eques TaxID=693459 RepID=UPI002ACDC6C3|nr:CD4-1 molecule isoform X1 [Phycodurus eques]
MERVPTAGMKMMIQVLIATALMWTTSRLYCCEEVFYVKEGDTVNLRLEELEANADYLYWSHSNLHKGRLAWRNPLAGWSFTTDERWISRLSISRNGLSITGVQEHDFGTVVFSRYIKQDGGATPMKIFRISKITVSVKSAYSPALPEEDVTLSCHVEKPQSHPRPDIYWLSPAGKRSRQTGGELIIYVSGRDNGWWSCVVVKDGGEDMATVFVSVLYLSPAPEYPLYTSEHSSLSIPCPFAHNISWEQFKFRDVKKVRWRYSPKMFSPRIFINPQNILFFSPTDNKWCWSANTSRGMSFVADLQNDHMILSKKQWRAEDRGFYMCDFKFSNHIYLRRAERVEVLQVVSSAGSELSSGQSVNLTCSLGRPLPKDHWVKWFAPKRAAVRSLLGSGRLDPAQINIPDVGMDDGGRWRCELWRNDTRLTSADITLTVSQQLNAWMLGSLCGSAGTIAVLLFLIYIIWRHRQIQRNTRRHRRHVCRCKHPKPKGFYSR